MGRSHCLIVKSCEIQILDQGPSRGARFLPPFSWEETMTSPWLSAYSGWWSNNHLEKYESQLGGIIPYIYNIMCIYIYITYIMENKIHVTNHQPVCGFTKHQTCLWPIDMMTWSFHVISRNWKLKWLPEGKLRKPEGMDPSSTVWPSVEGG